MVVSKYGPVPGVGYSCRKSVRKRLELPSDDPMAKWKKKSLLLGPYGQKRNVQEKKIMRSINDNVYCGGETFNFQFSFIEWARRRPTCFTLLSLLPLRFHGVDIQPQSSSYFTNTRMENVCLLQTKLNGAGGKRESEREIEGKGFSYRAHTHANRSLNDF